MNISTLEKTKLIKRLAIVFVVVCLILCIPLIAMQFTNQVNWKLFDFVIMGGVLFITGMSIAIIVERVKSAQLKLAYIILILLALFLIWAELAVGIFGSLFAGS